MLHYTLNTGHTRMSPRGEVGDQVLTMVAPMLLAGKHEMPGPIAGYTCVTTNQDGALIATVYAGKRPCVTFGVATNDAAADTLWPAIEGQYLRIGDLPGIRSADFAASHRPESTPWCAAMTILATPDEAMWIADFERCLAWAWILR